MYERDTIAAISTPAGKGGIGVVRVSGSLAPAIASRVFQASIPVHRWKSHRLYRGKLLSIEGAILDDGLGVWMRAPQTYTGEDVVEIHAHGSPVVLRHFLTHVFASGARPAEPGEFTKRAFLNGRLDLAQAEAVADLIEARTLHGAAAAAQAVCGSLSRVVQELRERLLHGRAQVEAQIDFGDEIELADEQVARAIEDVRAPLERLLATYRHGALVRHGARVVLTGKPNVGKSSLLNALLGADRAIVTDFPGTTRDTLEETIDCEGIPVTLIDTAGLREERTADPIERLGMERSVRAVEQADLVLFLIDQHAGIDRDDLAIFKQIQHRCHLVISNKSDLPTAPTYYTELPRLEPGGARVVRVSARTGAGLDLLRHSIALALGGDQSPPPLGEPVIAHARHYAALVQARAALDRAHEALDRRLPIDIVAVELSAANEALASIVGEVSAEDVLEEIFARFCLGK